METVRFGLGVLMEIIVRIESNHEKKVMDFHKKDIISGYDNAEMIGYCTEVTIFRIENGV